MSWTICTTQLHPRTNCTLKSSHSISRWENVHSQSSQSSQVTTQRHSTNTSISMASTSSNASDETARGRDQTRRETNTEPASENAPLLGLLGREPSSGPTEQSQPDREHSASGLLRRDPVPEDANTEPASENTPLLGRDTSPGVTEQSQPTREHSASGLLRALGGRSSRDGKGLKRRWPSLLALLLHHAFHRRKVCAAGSCLRTHQPIDRLVHCRWSKSASTRRLHDGCVKSRAEECQEYW
jgi:hypothetical protein